MDDWIEVRRGADGELLGFVSLTPEREWAALTVFGGTLGIAATQAVATAEVERRGLASLAERWVYRRRGTEEWQVVLVSEVWPGRARLVEGWYGLPGAERFEITTADLAAGDEITLDPSD